MITSTNHNTPFYWLNSQSREFLNRGYLSKGQSPEDRYYNIAQHAEHMLNIKGFANKFHEYLSKGFYSLSTPIITNYGNERGLPVSCFGSYIDDTMEHILETNSEIGMMSKMGGGTSGYFGALRPRGSAIKDSGESGGPNQFLNLLNDNANKCLREFILDGGSISHILELFDNVADTISQGSARRGSFAAYLPVEHPDIEEFLQIRSEGHPIQNMSIAVTITNKWMEEMTNGDKEKRKLWSKIIQKRFETGYPYITFIDNCNNAAPQVYKDRGLTIKAQNLCNEIALSSDENNSFVCVLSSLNLLHWDEIVKTDAIETMIYFLDTVNEEFVIKTQNIKCMERAHNFAKTQRALGLGVLGWHSLLQSKSIAFESMEAKLMNSSIWKTIKERSDTATEELAKMFGEPELLKGYGRRNVTTMAVAPTTSSSFILGQVSPSIEPLNSNYFVKKLAKGSFTYKNPYLKKLLKEKGKNDDETWKSILLRGGSVQHLDFLSEHEKAVYKTFGEMSQKEIVIQAAQRQKYIDQGQSLNIMVPLETKPKEVSELLIEGWRMGIKGFYYQRGASPAQALSRSIMTCTSCEA